MIQQLDLMEAEIDRYIAMNKSETGSSIANDHIYANASELMKSVDLVKKDLDEINSKVMQNVQNNDENLVSIPYENKRLKENINIDVNKN
jgi:hypothetical protein